MGAFRYISFLTGGLPHQSADWFAMTGNLLRSLSNTNLSFHQFVCQDFLEKYYVNISAEKSPGDAVV